MALETADEGIVGVIACAGGLFALFGFLCLVAPEVAWQWEVFQNRLWGYRVSTDDPPARRRLYTRIFGACAIVLETTIAEIAVVYEV